MSEILDLIFSEIGAAEEAAAKLRATASNAGRQTDLENAILRRTTDEAREKNKRAGEMIEKAMGILERSAVCRVQSSECN